MPIGTFKNTLYGVALPFVGKRCEWKAEKDSLKALLHANHTVGACIQRLKMENSPKAMQWAMHRWKEKNVLLRLIPFFERHP